MDNQKDFAIFRGRLKFKSNVEKIWGVLIFLSLITIVEVILGIIKPEIFLNYFLGIKILNWIFIILTLVKAYYITWDFMHMRDEVFGFKLSVVLTVVFLVLYLAFLLLVEADYIYEVMKSGDISWKF